MRLLQAKNICECHQIIILPEIIYISNIKYQIIIYTSQNVLQSLDTSLKRKLSLVTPAESKKKPLTGVNKN